MKRLAAVACAGLAALAVLILSAPAGAAVSPKLAITPTNAGGANLIVSGGSSNPAEDAFQKIQIYVPTGFGLKAPAGGAAVGTASGHALVKDVDATQEQNFTGKLTAAGLADPAFAYESSSCDNATHSAVWSMQITANDTSPVTIPIFVDRTTGSEAAFGPYKLVMCLRSPDLPQGDPNRSLTGTKIDNFVLTLSGFTVPTKAGDYRWRSLWTPYAPGTGNPNTAGTVEAQSVVRVPPGVLSLAAKKVTQKVNGRVQAVVRLSGKLLVAGEPAGNVKVGFSHGPTKGKLTSFGSVKTDAAGNYLITSRLTKATYFQGGVTLPRQELGPAGCQASFGSSIGCVNASISGFKVLSRLLYVR
jgi:hypothetical protein